MLFYNVYTKHKHTHKPTYAGKHIHRPTDIIPTLVHACTHTERPTLKHTHTHTHTHTHEELIEISQLLNGVAVETGQTVSVHL